MADFEAPEGELDYELLEVPDDYVEPEPEPDPRAVETVVTMTPQEYAALKQEKTASETLAVGIKEMTEALKGQSRPINVPAQGPTETDEEFNARIEKTVFESGKTVDALKEVAVRYVSPAIAQQAKALTEANRKIIALDPSRSAYFNKYQGEIEQEVARMPAYEQFSPDVYEKAYERVVKRHEPEIRQTEVEALLGPAVEAKLKELGIDPEKLKASGKPVVTLGSGAPPAPARQQIRVTAAEMNAIKRLEDLGFTAEDARERVIPHKIKKA